MTTTEVSTQDLHIVVAGLESQGHFVGYTAITGPLSYTDALAKWESSERSKLGINPRGRNKGHVRHFAVRSVADPRFAPLVGRGYADAIGRDGRRSYKGDDGDIKATKAWAKLYGWHGAKGGWIYDPQDLPQYQGWDMLCAHLKQLGYIARGSDGLWYVIDRELVA